MRTNLRHLLFCAALLSVWGVSNPTLAQPFVPQPVLEHSSLSCLPGGGVLFWTLQARGIVFDYEVAKATNLAVGAGWSDMVYQFNECFGGGMIDEIFDPVRYPNLTAGRVSAASASQHNECSVSIPGIPPGCAGGSGYGWPYSIAVAPPPLNSRLSFLFARLLDPFGPFAVVVDEHPQYKSNGAPANAHKLGVGGAAHRAIIFVGRDAGRADYHADARRIHRSLTGNGFPAANIDVLVGPGGANLACAANVPPGPAILYRSATRNDLILAPLGAIPKLAVAGGGTEYFLWYHDHGGRWLFLVFGLPILPIPLNASVDVDFGADQDFIDVVTTLPEIYVYVESLALEDVPVRVDLNGAEIYQDILRPGDNVFTFTNGGPATLVLGSNTITVHNDSTTVELEVEYLAVGTGPVETATPDPAPPFDPIEVENQKSQFGACCDANGECADGVLQEDCTDPGSSFFPGQLCSEVACGAPIPTVSEWGLIVMMLLLLTAGTIVIGRRRQPAVG